MKRSIITHYLPFGDAQTQRRIRVLLPQTIIGPLACLYLQDGQNLFFDHESYGKISWGVIETLDHFDKNDLMVIAIDNSPDRTFEYSPWPCSVKVAGKKGEIGGKGHRYADFIIHTVKPFIDQQYPTKKEPSATWIGGSSLGAYISCYIATLRPDLFGGVGVFSLASWFNESSFLNHMEKAPIPYDQRYFISVGDQESSSDEVPNFNEIYIQNSRNLRDLLHKKGVLDLYFQEISGIHHESTWRKAFVDFVAWIDKKV